MNFRELEDIKVNKWNYKDLEENMSKFIYNFIMGRDF